MHACWKSCSKHFIFIYRIIGVGVFPHCRRGSAAARNQTRGVLTPAAGNGWAWEGSGEYMFIFSSFKHVNQAMLVFYSIHIIPKPCRRLKVAASVQTKIHQKQNPRNTRRTRRNLIYFLGSNSLPSQRLNPERNKPRMMKRKKMMM